MDDTTPDVRRAADAFHAGWTARQRMEAAASMFETARAIVESSLPDALSDDERRRQWARRMYADSLPAAAIEQYARYRFDR